MDNKYVNPLTGEGFFDDDSLEHEGVKGMKWYRHQFGRWESHARYANGRPDPDAKSRSKSQSGGTSKSKSGGSKRSTGGTSRPSGGSGGSKRASSARTQSTKPKTQSTKPKGKSAADLEKEAEEKRIRQEEKLNRKKERYSRTPASMYRHRNLYTTKEIEDNLKRLELNKRLKSLSVDQINATKNTISGILDINENGIRGYNQLARVFNTISPEKKLRYVENGPGGSGGNNDKKKKK